LLTIMVTDHQDRGPFTDAGLGALRGALVRRARGIVWNHADAEDVVQTALERAWRRRAQFRPGSAIAPWLLKITARAAVDHLRAARSREEFSAGLSASEGIDAVVARAETLQEIASAAQSLRAPYRETWFLHDVQGLSAQEISAERELPYHTVRTHLARARKQLRHALSEAAS
jgi:RNA polymerase sigma-70 factor, ECF subfamily